MGNLISDFVKGKKRYDYPPSIQQGITLHRIIDTFTDSHEATAEAKEIFRPHYRLYSGAFIDVAYDHFLATDPNEFTDASLLAFSAGVYATIDNYTAWLPPPFAGMFPYMKSQNWLYHYRTMQGTQSSFGGLVRRAAYLTDSHTAFSLFEKHYQPLQQCYRQFWADAKPFVRRQFELIAKS